MPQVLKDQFEDPQDAGKNTRLTDLGKSLSNVGRAIEELYDAAPPQAKSANRRLSDSYREIGGKLVLIPNAQGEKQLIDAMLAYNNAVDVFVKNYVSVATLFSASGVTFRSDEAGSVFTFTAATL